VPPDLVRFWLIRADLPAGTVAALQDVLDDEERDRARAFLLDRHRHRFVVAHAAARVLVGAQLGLPAREIRWRRGPAGKPEVAGVQVNLSHSGRLAALALARDRPVGVDVQRLQPSLDAVRMSARYYPVAEARYVAAGSGRDARLRRFVALWTRKEACVKAAGGRLIPGLGLPVHRTPDPGARECVVDDGTRRYMVRDVPVPDGYLAAVALAGGDTFQIAYGRWPK
jgi:4'-phosphopantetheinyl transferase